MKKSIKYQVVSSKKRLVISHLPAQAGQLSVISFGFTLIELLVVISIIGILATLLLANYNATRSRARDSQRKSDLRNIQTALRVYYNDYSLYPDDTGSSTLNIKGCGTGASACTWGVNFVTSTQTYMSVLPKDPSADRKYNYDRTTDDTYTLEACLENTSDEKCGASPCGSAFSTTGASNVAGCVYRVQP